MTTKTLALIALCVTFTAPVVLADDLTEIVQKDLVALGYDPGNISGELSTDTIVAISKFQAENNIEVTGTPSPQLAGVIKATIKKKNSPGASAPPDPAALQAAQQQCLQEKIAAAQSSQKKKRGFGSLLRAVSRTATQLGGAGAMQDIVRVSSDIYAVDATAADLKSAAKDLGLTDSDLEECRNPSM